MSKMKIIKSSVCVAQKINKNECFRFSLALAIHRGRANVRMTSVTMQFIKNLHQHFTSSSSSCFCFFFWFILTVKYNRTIHTLGSLRTPSKEEIEREFFEICLHVVSSSQLCIEFKRETEAEYSHISLFAIAKFMCAFLLHADVFVIVFGCSARVRLIYMKRALTVRVKYTYKSWMRPNFEFCCRTKNRFETQRKKISSKIKRLARERQMKFHWKTCCECVSVYLSSPLVHTFKKLHQIQNKLSFGLSFLNWKIKKRRSKLNISIYDAVHPAK